MHGISFESIQLVSNLYFSSILSFKLLEVYSATVDKLRFIVLQTTSCSNWCKSKNQNVDEIIP